MMTVTVYCWMTVSPASARRPFPILCCASISAMRFYLPTKSCMRTFSNSALITAQNAGLLLYRIPTGRNIARLAAKESTAGRKTKAKESAAWTVRGAETPCLQGLFKAETKEKGL